MHDFEFKRANVYKLPYDDNTFDMVTCQTLLIHLDKPEKALTEMKRVVKPGGLIAVVEPNNSIRAIASLTPDYKVEEILEDVENELKYEKGKINLNDGFDSYGPNALKDFKELGLYDIQSFLSDKCTALYPPYSKAEQAEIIKEIKEDIGPSAIEINQECERYTAGGGAIKEFRKMVKERKKVQHKLLVKIEKATYMELIYGIILMVSGRKG